MDYQNYVDALKEKYTIGKRIEHARHFSPKSAQFEGEEMSGTITKVIESANFMWIVLTDDAGINHLLCVA